MQSLTLALTQVIVVKAQHNCDVIYLYFNGKPPYPGFSETLPSLKLEVARGTGVDYCKNELNLVPDEVIDINGLLKNKKS